MDSVDFFEKIIYIFSGFSNLKTQKTLYFHHNFLKNRLNFFLLRPEEYFATTF